MSRRPRDPNLDPDGPSAEDLARFDPDPDDDTPEYFEDESPFGLDPAISGRGGPNLDAADRARAKERGIAAIVFVVIAALVLALLGGALL